MARSQVFDTTVLIQALRQPARLPALVRAVRSGRTWLTSVTVAELYAGTTSSHEGGVLDQLLDSFARRGRLLTPEPEEWRQAGQLIARWIRLYGALEPRDHLADVLIVLLAARLNGAVVTANRKHFDRWAALAAQAGRDVTVTSETAPG